jgi:hypothetical protein
MQFTLREKAGQRFYRMSGLFLARLPYGFQSRFRKGDLYSAFRNRMNSWLLIVRGELRESIWSGFFKARQTAAEDEAHFVRGPVALLGD